MLYQPTEFAFCACHIPGHINVTAKFVVADTNLTRPGVLTISVLFFVSTKPVCMLYEPTEFTFCVCHIPGHINVTADFLSRGTRSIDHFGLV